MRSTSLLTLLFISFAIQAQIADKFMVVSDMHHYSPAGDFTQTMLYELGMAAIDEQVDFIFFTGDLIIRNFSTPEQEESVLRDWRFLLDTLAEHNIRIFACRGNNDVGSGDAWNVLFSGKYALPQNGPENEKNLTYAIEYDNLLFLSLDQYTDLHKINQPWLDDILTVNPKEHVFAAGHEPAFKLLNSSCMGAFPEERNAFWESLTTAGAKAFFCGHDHFYDHSVLEDGDDATNDIHQVIVGTGGSILSNSQFDGDNGRWTPHRLFHDSINGYVLVEIIDTDVKMKWKRRTEPNIFEEGGDTYTFPKGTTASMPVPEKKISIRIIPNPFTEKAVINYETEELSKIEICILTISGHKIESLINDMQPPGNYTLEWKTNGMNPGIYVCRIRMNNLNNTVKFILLK